MDVVLCAGCDPALFSLARVEGGFDRNIPIVELSEGDTALYLKDIVARGSSLGDPSLDLDTGQCFVIVAGERNTLDKVMKGFKKAYKAPAGRIIFALLTETAKEWTLEAYLKELGAEHKEMQKYRGKILSGNADESNSSLHEKQKLP